MICSDVIQTPFGKAVLYEENGALTCFSLMQAAPAEAALCDTPLLKKAKAELAEYFSGVRKSFDLPLAPQGTIFQQKVWRALLTIPYGKTSSYAEIAAQCQNPKACRAVGMASHFNPLWILIPCHRVIGKNGTLTGYACGTSVKQALLELEKKYM